MYNNDPYYISNILGEGKKKKVYQTPESEKDPYEISPIYIVRES